MILIPNGTSRDDHAGRRWRQRWRLPGCGGSVFLYDNRIFKNGLSQVSQLFLFLTLIILTIIRFTHLDQKSKWKGRKGRIITTAQPMNAINNCIHVQMGERRRWWASYKLRTENSAFLSAKWAVAKGTDKRKVLLIKTMSSRDPRWWMVVGLVVR